MPNEDNLLNFPEAANDSATPVASLASYHYSAFRIGKDGQTTWFDGIAQLDGVILTQEDYLGLKKLLTEHYDIPESNFVISSLNRLDTLQLEVPPAQVQEQAQTVENAK